MRVLLPVDGSKASFEAAKYLSQIQGPETMEITVLTVIGLPKISLANSASNELDQFVARSKQNDELVFTRVRECFAGGNASLRHVSIQGHIGHSIVSVAEDLNVELIVMGATGRSRHEHLVLGSVSEYVTANAPCSVLVVRPVPESNSHSQNVRITLAYDDSAASRAAAQRVGDIKWSADTEVEVLSVVPIHVVHPLDTEAIEVPRSEDELRNVEEYAAEAMRQLTNRGIRAHTKIVMARHVGIQIAAESRTNPTDLIVLGATGQTGMARPILGSVSQYVVRHAIQPVWIVRER
jgi:nucleotide-binding universal stress UspA family protein